MNENLKNYSLDGKILPVSGIGLKHVYRGFLYADGIFETLRVRNYHIFRRDWHWERLEKGADICGISVHVTKNNLERNVVRLLRTMQLKDAYVRVNLWRKQPPGFDPGEKRDSHLMILAKPFKAYPAKIYRNGVRCILSKTITKNPDSPVTYIKSLSFLEPVLARLEAKNRGYDDAILLNTKDSLSEAAVSNIFFVRKETVCTPSVECGLLPGITRKIIIELCGKYGIQLKEGVFSVKDITEADEIFLTNTLAGIIPVAEISGVFKKTVFEQSRFLAKKLSELFEEETNE